MMREEIIKQIQDTGKVSIKAIDNIGIFMDELKAAGYCSHVDESGQWLLVNKQEDKKVNYSHW